MEYGKQNGNPFILKINYLFYDAKSGKNPGDKRPIERGGSFSITLQPLEVKVFNA